MDVAVSAARETAFASIDVLAFPPDTMELQCRQASEARRWRELERRSRIALFFGVGMFLAWAADVGAAFGIAHASGSAWFGAISVPLALIVVLAHVYGQWALERATRGLAEVKERYSDVTVREATPLLAVAQKNAVIEQYLRCVGRQQRALRRLERMALYAWIEGHRGEANQRRSTSPTVNNI
ncbi:MAG: hypothetical protein ABI580_00220 [Burkholderiaceae bacterium]